MFEKKDYLVFDICCAPCLSGVYPQVRKYYHIFPFFIGDNICCLEEYEKRKKALLNYLKIYNIDKFYIKEYDHDEWLKYIKGFEDEIEGRKRCELCFEYRIITLLNYLKENSLDIFLNSFFENSSKENNCLCEKRLYISTTLSISRYKNYETIEKIFLQKIADNVLIFDFDINFLKKNFSNNDWYKKSIKISKALGLYRQKFCGCEFSIRKKKK